MDRRTAMKSFAGIAAMGVAATSGASVLAKESALEPGLNAESLPVPTRKGGLAFLTAEEAEIVGAIFDRLIPADDLGMGAKEAGCVQFLDAQLAGDYGKAATMYRRGPFVKGTAQQGPQDKTTPAERYRAGLAAWAKYVQGKAGKPFSELGAQQQDELLQQLETGKITLENVDGEAFFALMVQNVREGYFADPMYGGNKDMVGWKLVGFPGARYDYRDVIGKRGQKLDIAPVSLLDRNS